MPDSIVGTEYLPNAHIENITYQSFDRYQKANVTVAVYDYEEKTWSADEKFTGYFFVSCFVVWKKQFIEEINSGTFLLSNISTGRSSFTEKFKFGLSAMEETTTSIRGKTYTKYKKIFSFVIPEPVQDLSCYANSMIDLEDLIQNEDLDLSYSTFKSYMGSLKSEKIIEDNSFVLNSSVFRDENGNPWSGPVHRHPGKGFMEGSQHSSRKHGRLVLEDTPYQKVQYLTDITSEIPSAIAGPRSTTPLMQAGVDSYHPSMHQMDFVEDIGRNVSNTVVADLGNILLQESPVAAIMYRYDREAFTRITQATNIKHIDVKRFSVRSGVFFNRLGMLDLRPIFTQSKLIARSHNNRSKVKNKTLFKISPTEIFSVDPKTLASNKKTAFFNGKNISLEMIRGAPKIGKIEQLNLSLDPSLRPITFTDHSIKNAKEGRYKYRIKITIEDEHLLYCKQLLKDLLHMQNKIQNLHNVLIMKNVFDGDNFSIKFLQEFYSQYDISVNVETGFVDGEFNTEALQNSYLIKSFEKLLEAEKLIGRRPSAPRMINNLNLFVSNLDKIQQTSRYFGIIINRFKTTYDLSDGESYDKSSSKSRKDRGVIEKSLILRKEYKRELLMPIGVNFINMNPPSEGMPFIDIFDFDNRASKEVSKFFTGPINLNSDALSVLPEGLANSLGNIEEKKYVNFSPAKIFLGNKEVDTTKITTESFDVDFFNALRITAAALESEDNVNPENIIDEEKIEKYLDSRIFLGDNSKFNNLVLSSLKLKPKLLPKIRKKFKFLENSILKSKKKNISLKSFDFKQPNSFIVSNLKENGSDTPLQIKALGLLKTPITNFDLNTINFDPISNPQTQEVFMQNYLNIGKVEALMGFEKVNGRFMMDKPIYREINSQIHEKLKNMNVLCRITPQTLSGLEADNEKQNIHDKVFVMHSINDNQTGEEDV